MAPTINVLVGVMVHYGCMAITRTKRFDLEIYSEGSDPFPGREEHNAEAQKVEAMAARVYPSSEYKNRPTTNIFGSFFMATDQGVNGRLYYNGGIGWVPLNTVGGGGAGTPVVINGASVEGSSLLAARADHTHNIPLATKSNAGAMPSQWAQLCEDASSRATANSVAVRDSGGRLTANEPVSATHVATMDWVQSKAGSTGTGGMTLARRDTAGRLNTAMPVSPTHATPKSYVDSRIPNADKYATGDALIQRWSSGTGGNVEDPVNPMELANRRYVDSRKSRREWKTNIEPLSVGLEQLLALEPVTFDYKDDAPAVGKNVHGAIVEDFAEVLPDLTTVGEDGKPERINDRELIWVLVKGIQELHGAFSSLAVEVDNCHEIIANLVGDNLNG